MSFWSQLCKWQSNLFWFSKKVKRLKVWIPNIFQFIFIFRVDKIILKVAKKRTNIVQILKTLGPSYVSVNTVVGKQDCLRLFPDDYNVELEEPEDDTIEGEEGEENGKKKKRKKKKKKRRQSEIDASEQTGEVSIESDETLDG